MVSEELKIIIRAEAKAAIDEMKKFQKTTGDTSAEMMKFAKQLLGPLGVGYAVREVVRFMKDSVAAYYQATGEVNKLAEATKYLKIGIGDMIANSPLVSWLGDVALKAMEGAREIVLLRAALKDLQLDVSLSTAKQIEQVKLQIAEVKAAMPKAEELVQRAVLQPEVYQRRLDELNNLKTQKTFWEWKLASLEVQLMGEKAITAEAEKQKKIQWEMAQFSNTWTPTQYARLGMLPQQFDQYAGNAYELQLNPFLPYEPNTGYKPDFGSDLATQMRNQRQSEAQVALENAVPWQEVSKGADAISDIQKTMNEMAGEGAVREVASLFRSMGEAMAGAKEPAEVLADAIAGISNMLSEVFLWGALAAFKADNVYLGTGYLIAAGVFGMVGGFMGSVSVPSSSSVSRGRMSSSGKGNVYGLGENIQNPTGTVVVQNISGSVWQTDQLQALAANSARSLKSGR